ncbi:MAG: FAD-dependent oxidoreductase [Xanthobacteraceae bacterium]|nr:FAD-dependent oxidoreductase [Xanthobacteraceae bacterium]
MKLTRRDFMAGAAAFAAIAPRQFATAATLPREVDVAIVGGGAAGIAAARKVVASGRSAMIIEAGAGIGGRCTTDSTSFNTPFDRGARWLYNNDTNPLIDLARTARIDLVQGPRGQRIRIGRRNARAGETEEFLALVVRVNRAMQDAIHTRGDLPAAQALPNDVGDWAGTLDFQLGAMQTGKNLGDLSAADLLTLQPREPLSYCRQGVGTLIARLADKIPVALSTPVTAIKWSARDAQIETGAGTLTARAVIVTASASVLNAGVIKFTPELPKRQSDALSKLTLGSFDHIALELPGNPLGLARDDSFIEKSSDRRTGLLLANIGATSLCQVDVAGSFGAELSAQGEAAMVDFAAEWLRNLFGGDIAKAVQRKSVTRWNNVPYVMGAMSAALPGGQPSRRILMEPLGSLFFAGEAIHETQWGSVNGAWASGERAAEAAIRKVSGAKAEGPVGSTKERAKTKKRSSQSAPSHASPASKSRDRGLSWPGSGF